MGLQVGKEGKKKGMSTFGSQQALPLMTRSSQNEKVLKTNTNVCVFIWENYQLNKHQSKAFLSYMCMHFHKLNFLKNKD